MSDVGCQESVIRGQESDIGRQRKDNRAEGGKRGVCPVKILKHF